MNTEKFVACARLIHGDRYNYDDVEYTNSHDHVTILCPEHGEFKQSPSKHLFGSGCMQCVGRRATGDFITRAREIHGDRYDYSNVSYTCAREHVMISCPGHGFFSNFPTTICVEVDVLCVLREEIARDVCAPNTFVKGQEGHTETDMITLE